MTCTGTRLCQRWAVALAFAVVFVLLGNPQAAVVVLLSWAPPTVAFLALRIKSKAGTDSLLRATGA